MFYRSALVVGFSRAFEVSAVILLAALIVTIAVIRVRRSDLEAQRPRGTLLRSRHARA